MALSPLSGTLSNLGAEVRRDRIALLSKLIEKVTGFTDCENFDIALDFALYNIEHHRFLDVDPEHIEELYTSLEERLDRNAMLSKKKKLVQLKQEVIDVKVEHSALVKDINYQCLSLLYWLAGNPIATEVAGLEKVNSVHKKEVLPVGERHSSESEEWSSESDIYVCDSSSSLSDWDISDTEETVDKTSYGQVARPSEGYDVQSPNISSTSAVTQETKGGMSILSAKEQHDIACTIRDKVDEAELRIIRKVILMLHGKGNYHDDPPYTEEDFTHSCQELKYSYGTLHSMWTLFAQVSENTRYLNSSIENCSSSSLFPTLSSYLEALRYEMNPFSTLLVSLERKAISDDYFTLLELAVIVQNNVHYITYLENVAKVVFSSISPSDPACVVASSILSILNGMWIQSGLQSEFAGFNASKLAFRLLKKSLGPYSRYLSTYLSEGRLVDPKGEFFICIDSNVELTSEAFWSSGHSIRTHGGKESGCIPSFLHKLKDKILSGGKALCLLQKHPHLESIGGQSVSNIHRKERENSLRSFHLPFTERMANSLEGDSIDKEPKVKRGDLGHDGPKLIRMIRDGFKFGNGQALAEDPTSVLPTIPNTFSTLHTNGKEFQQAQELLSNDSNAMQASRTSQWHNRAEEEPVHSKLRPPYVLVEELIQGPIEKHCMWIQKTLMNSLREEHQLLDELENLKRIYLYGSDTVLNFMYGTFDRMSTSNFWDDETELSSIFQEYVMHDTSDSDLENVAIKLNAKGGQQDSESKRVHSFRYRPHTMEEVERIHLSYQLKWPLKIFINESTFEKYNDVFAYLSQVKSAEHALHKLFSLKWKTGRGSSLQVFWKANGIDFFRHELSHFVGVLHQYIVDQVICAGWKEALQNMKKADTIDTLCCAHNAFLANAMQQCLVGSDKLWILLSSRIKAILNIVLQFCAFAQELCTTVEVSASFVANSKSRYDKLRQDFQENRNFLLTILTSKVRLGSIPQLRDLLMRLNYNEFYTLS